MAGGRVVGVIFGSCVVSVGAAQPAGPFLPGRGAFGVTARWARATLDLRASTALWEALGVGQGMPSATRGAAPGDTGGLET